MAKPYVITALDIGSGSIKVLSVLKKPGESDFEILGQAHETSSGIRRGVVVDISRVANTISSLIKKVEQDSGQKISGVYAGVGGGHIFSTCSRGLVSVSRADKRISEEDINRVLQAAQTFPLPSNKEILETFPKEFIVDGEGGIKEVAGMEGVRLETDALVLCGFSPYLRNSSQAILDSGVQVNYLTPVLLASSRAVLTSREKELGVCLLDIGAGTTSMSVFEEGNLIHAIVFPVGSGHITNDIAVCLKTDIDTAERIKIEFGTCKSCSNSKKRAEKPIRIDLSTESVNLSEREEPLVFSNKLLVNIVEARVSEIFDLVNKELKKISRSARLPAGIVLTGGGSKTQGIKELAKKELKLPCRVGSASGFSAFNEDPSFSALYGLMLEGIDLEEEEERPSSFNKIKNFFQKIFGMFIP